MLRPSIGPVLTCCGLLRPLLLRSWLLLGAPLRLGPPLLAQPAPHAGAAEHGEEVVEGTVGPGCLVCLRCRRALRVRADTLSEPMQDLSKCFGA